MPQVTLIGSLQAKKGYEFIFYGPLQECKNCKLTHICYNLKPYNTYQIQKVRNKKHNCSIHEGSAVVVEVIRKPIITAIDKKYSKGSKTTINKIQCEEKLCPYHKFCTTPAVKPDVKYKINKILEEINCPKNKSIQKVEISE